VAVNSDGKREIVGLHIGPSEAETFWSTFLTPNFRAVLENMIPYQCGHEEMLRHRSSPGKGPRRSTVQRSRRRP